MGEWGTHEFFKSSLQSLALIYLLHTQGRRAVALLVCWMAKPSLRLGSGKVLADPIPLSASSDPARADRGLRQTLSTRGESQNVPVPT